MIKYFLTDTPDDFNKTCIRIRQNSEDSIGSDVSLSPPTSPLRGPEVIDDTTVSAFRMPTCIQLCSYETAAWPIY